MTSPFHYKEIISAAPDAMAIAMGVRVPHPHPLAVGLTLKEIAHASGMLNANGLNMDNPNASIARGLMIGDFSAMLATGAQNLSISAFVSQAQHAAFCSVVEAKNFHPVDPQILDGYAGLDLDFVGELGEIGYGEVNVAATLDTARLVRYARIIALTRKEIVNDTMGNFSRLLVRLGASAARLEARLVADALNLNPVMTDGQTIFDLSGADSKNNVLSLPISAANLGLAMTKLRNQVSASGGRADLAARHLVVSSELEFTACTIVKASGLNIDVHALAYLPADRWFLLCDPMIQPVVGTLKLNDEPNVLRIKAVRRRPDGNDGAAVRIVADLGATMISRIGVVRGGM